MQIPGRLLGLLIGGTIGAFIGSPFLGALVGYWLGGKADPKPRASFGFNPFMTMFTMASGHSAAQQAFFDATFSVMGHIAKSDGRVSENEIRAARQLMQQLRMGAAMQKTAMHAFNRGKQSEFNLQEELTQFRQACGRQQMLFQIFMQVQYQAAAADGSVSAAKKKILSGISKTLGVNSGQDYYQSFYSQFQGAHGHQRAYGPQSNTMGTGDAYRTLEIDSKATDDEVKKAYRRLMHANHPDKLVAKGLPEEMIKIANEKVARIKSAYEAIKAARGMK